MFYYLTNIHMKAETFERHIVNKKRHWWFGGRREILNFMLSMEKFFLNYINFPFGLSILFLSKKK